MRDNLYITEKKKLGEIPENQLRRYHCLFFSESLMYLRSSENFLI